jgi:hypothetical protein
MYTRKAVEFGTHVKIGNNQKKAAQYMWALPFMVAIVPHACTSDEIKSIIKSVNNQTYDGRVAKVGGCTLLDMMGLKPKNTEPAKWIDAQLKLWTPGFKNKTHLVKSGYSVGGFSYKVSDRVLILPLHHLD